jgi:hypothetical protein
VQGAPRTHTPQRRQRVPGTRTKLQCALAAAKLQGEAIPKSSLRPRQGSRLRCTGCACRIAEKVFRQAAGCRRNSRDPYFCAIKECGSTGVDRADERPSTRRAAPAIKRGALQFAEFSGHSPCFQTSRRGEAARIGNLSLEYEYRLPFLPISKMRGARSCSERLAATAGAVARSFAGSPAASKAARKAEVSNVLWNGGMPR